MFDTIQQMVSSVLFYLFNFKTGAIIELVVDTLSRPVAIQIYMALLINTILILFPGFVSIKYLWEKGHEQ